MYLFSKLYCMCVVDACVRPKIVRMGVRTVNLWCVGVDKVGGGWWQCCEGC